MPLNVARSLAPAARMMMPDRLDSVVGLVGRDYSAATPGNPGTPTQPETPTTPPPAKPELRCAP
jgi:hypothetical protein